MSENYAWQLSPFQTKSMVGGAARNWTSLSQITRVKNISWIISEWFVGWRYLCLSKIWCNSWKISVSWDIFICRISIHMINRTKEWQKEDWYTNLMKYILLFIKRKGCSQVSRWWKQLRGPHNITSWTWNRILKLNFFHNCISEMFQYVTLLYTHSSFWTQLFKDALQSSLYI